jgi:predicted ester cyclase
MEKLDFIIHILKELFEKGNLLAIEEAFDLNYTAHAGEKTYHGHAFINKYAKQIRKSINNIKVVKVTLLAQNDDILTWQRTFTGVHTKALKGIPASNKKVRWYEIVVTRFEKGKIIEEWMQSDLAFQMMLKQHTIK